MSRSDRKSNMPIGLDVGTSRIVTARQSEQGHACDSQLNAFVTIPYSRMAAGSLEREGIPHAVEGEAIIVHGNESERFAELLHTELRRPMKHGMLNAGEPDSAKLIGQIAGALLGEAQAGQKVCFTVPAAVPGAEQDLTYHEATIRQMLGEMGFEATGINEGLAVVYSELADTNYTGIGVSCGGGLCNVCFAYLSVPVLSFSVAKAGDFIDASAASVSGEIANHIRALKEQGFSLNGHYGDKIQQVLSIYYDEVIRAVAAGMQEEFGRRAPKVSRPVALVLSGGSAMPKGFRERFEKIVKESDLGVPLGEVRMAADPLTSTARGALAAALSEA